MGIRLTWSESNSGETGHRVYRSLTTMDPAALPVPLAELGPDVTQYEDGSALDGQTYFYRVSALLGDAESVSGEIEVVATATASTTPARDAVTVALVVADIENGATANTKQALVDAGFLDANITVALDSSAPPAADILVICRAVNTQADWDLISPAWAAGTPVLFGSAVVVADEPGQKMSSTFAGVTGLFTTGDVRTDAIDIVDTSQYITQPFSLGPLTILAEVNYGMALDPGASFVGTRLANGDPGDPGTAGNPALIVVPAGTLDLVGNPTPAKSVVWGDIYGGQSAYTADGAELLARCVDWCLS